MNAFIDFLKDSSINEMARTIRSDVTGLQKSLWIGNTRGQHAPRVKIILDKNSRGNCFYNDNKRSA